MQFLLQAICCRKDLYSAEEHRCDVPKNAWQFVCRRLATVLICMYCRLARIEQRLASIDLQEPARTHALQYLAIQKGAMGGLKSQIHVTHKFSLVD